MTVKDVFGFATITLKGTNGGAINLKPVDIVAMEELDEGTKVYMAHQGVAVTVMVDGDIESIKKSINELAEMQNEEHKKMEEEASKKARDAFLNAHPNMKKAYIEDMKNKMNGK